IFGLSQFLRDRFKLLSDQFYVANKKISMSRASWGVLFAALGSAGYYGAYLIIIFRTVSGELSIGDLTFLSGSFARMRGLLESILTRFSSVTEGSLYLQDFFEFFEIQPRIKTQENARPVPRPIQDGFVFENVGFKYENSE